MNATACAAIPGLRMLAAAGASLLLAGAACAQAPVATVLGETVTRDARAADGAAAVRADVDRIWSLIERDYIAARGLRATRDEIDEFEDYEREFRRRDRAQRARKLEELDERLKSPGLTDRERAFATEFRDVLLRLAAHDAQADRTPADDDPRSRAARAAWIESFKTRRALFEEFGGIVGVTRFGHYPFGARARLVASYERDGRLSFADPAARTAFFEAMEQPPRDAVRPGSEDFTPYWRLPIPSSYYPEDSPR